MDYIEIILIVCAIVLALLAAAIVTWCLFKRFNKATIEHERPTGIDNPMANTHNNNNYDVEAQKETYNANRSGHQINRNFDVYSNNMRQQSTPQFLALSSGTRPVQVVLPSHQQQKDSSQKFTQYAKIDLHQFTLKEAMTYFKIFINESIKEYRNNQNSRKNRFIEVITGRGKHSPNGIPVIKPAVENFLKKHQYKYVWANPGMVRIDLLSSADSDSAF